MNEACISAQYIFLGEVGGGGGGGGVNNDLFSKIFEVFNEMEMEINVINNEIFTKSLLKIRVKGK